MVARELGWEIDCEREKREYFQMMEIFHILVVAVVTRLYIYQNSLNLTFKIMEFYCLYDLYFNNAV